MQASAPLTFPPVVHRRVCPKCSWKLLSSYIRLVSSVQDFFFYLGFLSRTTFTNLWTAANGGGHFFNSSLQGWEAWGAPPTPSYVFFRKPSPSKPMSLPMGRTPYSKMKSHIWKTTPPAPPPLKRNAPFHEMIPRKSKINNNLKSS